MMYLTLGQIHAFLMIELVAPGNAGKDGALWLV